MFERLRALFTQERKVPPEMVEAIWRYTDDALQARAAEEASARRWDIYHMEHALLAASKSLDPSTKVGAVCVNPDTQTLISMGYNGLPRGMSDDPELLADRDRKYAFTAHAERNALDHRDSSVRGATMYVTMFPCVRYGCASSIVQSGIRRLVVLSHMNERWEDDKRLALDLFTKTGVKVEVIDMLEVDQHLLRRAGLITEQANETDH